MRVPSATTLDHGAPRPSPHLHHRSVNEHLHGCQLSPVLIGDFDQSRRDSKPVCAKLIRRRPLKLHLARLRKEERSQFRRLGQDHAQTPNSILLMVFRRHPRRKCA